MSVYNRHIFQDSNKDNYFEGWYYKNVTIDNKTISFIPGISKTVDDSHSFIQIISLFDNKTHYIRFDYDDFSYGIDPFYVKIKNNYFSLEQISLDIAEPIKVKGTIYFDNITPIKTTKISPNIMGPFAYLPFMECNHSLISLRHNLHGKLLFENRTICFDSGVGYIEKDYGTSFPKKYLWLQSNSSQQNNSLFLSYAVIPYSVFKFNGLICIYEYKGVQYRFATYNFARVIKFQKDHQNNIEMIIKKGYYKLKILINLGSELPLIAPKNGEMKHTIYESLNSKATIKLYYKGKEIAFDDFYSCGLEVFNM